MKLYDLPQRTERGVKIYPRQPITVEGEKYDDAVILFHHLDGMYSYCTLLDKEGDTIIYKDGSKAVIHLSVGTPLIKYKDSYAIEGV